MAEIATRLDRDQAQPCTPCMPSVIAHHLATLRSAIMPRTVTPFVERLLPIIISIKSALQRSAYLASAGPKALKYLLMPLGAMVLHHFLGSVYAWVLCIVLWPGWLYWACSLSAVALTWMFTRQESDNRHAKDLRKLASRWDYLKQLDAQYSTVASGNSIEWVNTVIRMLWGWYLEPEFASLARYVSHYVRKCVILSCVVLSCVTLSCLELSCLTLSSVILRQSA
jgi:hypothetical protein